MQRVALNNYICGTLTVMFVALVVVMAYFTVRMSLPRMEQHASRLRQKRLISHAQEDWPMLLRNILKPLPSCRKSRA